MRRALIAIAAPFAVVGGAAVAIVSWERGAFPGFRPPLADVEVGTITREHRGVRISGTAHYEARLSQRTEAGDETWNLFPLFPKGDTIGREIRVMVRTHREPDPLYGFEDLTIEGFCRPPGRAFPPYAREPILRLGYHFSEDFVIVEPFDEQGPRTARAVPAPP